MFKFISRFFKWLFGMTDKPVEAPVQTPPVVSQPVEQPLPAQYEETVTLYDVVSDDFTETVNEISTTTTKGIVMSNDATIIAEISKQITESNKLIDDLLDKKDAKALPSSNLSTVKLILARIPDLSTAQKAVVELDWYEARYQTLVNAIAAGKIKNTPIIDAAGRIAHANQAIEGAYKNLAAAGIDLKAYGAKGPSK